MSLEMHVVTWQHQHFSSGLLRCCGCILLPNVNLMMHNMAFHCGLLQEILPVRDLFEVSCHTLIMEDVVWLKDRAFSPIWVDPPWLWWREMQTHSDVSWWWWCKCWNMMGFSKWWIILGKFRGKISLSWHTVAFLKRLFMLKLYKKQFGICKQLVWF